MFVAQKDLHRAGDYRAASYRVLFAASSAFRAENGAAAPPLLLTLFSFSYARSCFSPFWTLKLSPSHERASERGKRKKIPLHHYEIKVAANFNDRPRHGKPGASWYRGAPKLCSINRNTRFVVKIKSERRNENLTRPFLSARVTGTCLRKRFYRGLSPRVQLLSLFPCVRIFIFFAPLTS